jgi:hypothetical protein
MSTGRVTKRAVEALAVPAQGKREHLWDDTLKGFGVMVTDRGARSYLVQYRIGGRGSPTRRVTIGKHGSPWTAERARDRAVELLEQVRRKVDPFAPEAVLDDDNPEWIDVEDAVRRIIARHGAAAVKEALRRAEFQGFNLPPNGIRSGDRQP